MENVLASCQELLFPSLCLGCGCRLPLRRVPLYCDRCRENIIHIGPPCCPGCGCPLPAGDDHYCGPCLSGGYFFSLARSALFYQPPLTTAISELKFGGRMSGLSSLAALARMAPAMEELSPPDLILPVPLHPERLRQRGFNQALLLARCIFSGRRDRIDCTALARPRPTLPQTGLSGQARRRNLSGAFSVIHSQKVFNSRILLIDDVFTTGSTVNECARVLLRAGASRVEVFTLARAA